MFSEAWNNAFMVDGTWKLVGKGVASPKGPVFEKWELYDLDKDRSELNNLASKEPRRLREMIKPWKEWSLEDKVYPKPLPNKTAGFCGLDVCVWS